MATGGNDEGARIKGSDSVLPGVKVAHQVLVLIVIIGIIEGRFLASNSLEGVR